MKKFASLCLRPLPSVCVALGLSLSTLQSSVFAIDAPTKGYTEAFQKEIELTISNLALSGEYDQAIRSWGEIVAEDAWLLVMREGISVSSSSDMANSSSSNGNHSVKKDVLVARRAIQLLDERREKTFSTLSALDALTVSKLTLKIVDAATDFECCSAFPKKAA